MPTSRISRHFASIPDSRRGPRQVHYRRAGRGPALILLHQSPLSSRDLVTTMERWQRHFTCIAPDTPGYGLSDPLGVTHAEMDEFAAATIEFLDAIGVGKAAFYGFHTGAMMAAMIAARHPERVHAVVANGYVIPTSAERAELVAEYLPPFVPTWDGAHLAWLWSRMREQTIFFPWYRKEAADRLAINVPPPEALQANLVEFLRAGDHYRVAYRAAFTMPAAETLREIEVPALITASQTDPTSRYLARATAPAPMVEVRACPTAAATLDLALAHLRRAPGSAAPKAIATRAITGRLWQQMLDVPGGQWRVRRNHDAAGRPVVVVHDAAGSADTVAPLAASFIGRRPVIALDLPGHGESGAPSPPARGAALIRTHAQALRRALDALRIRECDVVGVQGGSLIGLELASIASRRVRRLVLVAPPYFDRATQVKLRERYVPDISLDGHGGHLLAAWHFLRDHGLFWPWYERTVAAILHGERQIDPGRVHQRVLELFRAPEGWRRMCLAQFAYPVKVKLRAAKVPMLLAAADHDPLRDATLAAARAQPAIPFCALPENEHDWGEVLLRFLDA
ncbi:MAG: 2-succinyl-6-hydroxy-2,4-cyclohexadiene-1-carboxylate synthase [Steroidobacteraceae bacterium]|nr:2-succinyl-6-hydroxy-2,4-cyclohexadiene-1-carboxylate synthase [Steroidobacteraceae bacterium]